MLIVNNSKKYNTNIQFIIETQINNIIEFLNLIYDNDLNFYIYRKRTKLDIINPNNSNHPFLENVFFIYFLIM